MSILEIVKGILSLVLDLVPHEEAQQLLSEEAQRRANDAADAVAKARVLSGT
jgi:hypothetical protein